MTQQEQELAEKAHSASQSLDLDQRRGLIDQRQAFEDILKLSANSLSNKTTAETLVKLLRICAFIENDKLTDRLTEYLKPKVNQLENQELSQVFQSLVLLAKQDSKFIKTVELLTMRRMHSLNEDQLSQIIKAYSLLLQQHKLERASISFIQAFEAIISSKSNQYRDNLGGLVQALCALFRIYNLTQATADGAMVSKDHLLAIVETTLQEMEALEEEDEEMSMTPAQLAELYMSTFVLQTTEDFSHSLDFTPLNTLLQKSISQMRAKDIFRIMHMHTQARVQRRNLLPNHIRGIDESVALWMQSNFQTLMPEEVVMVLQQNSSSIIVNKAADYLNFQLD